jgi:membrane-bound ClpP family serine protease
MLELYYGLLAFGVIAALASLLLGDLISDAMDGIMDSIPGGHLPIFEPMVLFGGLTTLGGAGVLLTNYTELTGAYVFILALLLAILQSILVYFLYIKPMEKTENSVAFSEQDLVGQIAEVTIPIPEKGFGEVVINMGGGLTNQIAASFDSSVIETGAKVVVVELKDRCLYVSRLDSSLF